MLIVHPHPALAAERSGPPSRSAPPTDAPFVDAPPTDGPFVDGPFADAPTVAVPSASRSNTVAATGAPVVAVAPDAPTRSGGPAPHVPARRSARGARGERGQATAEYALVLLGAAAVALLLVAWAASSGLIGELFDTVVRQIISRVG